MLLLLFAFVFFAECVNNVINTTDHHPETLEELTSDTNSLVEGDILLNSQLVRDIRTRRKVTTEPLSVKDNRNAMSTVWPTTHIPYEISPEIESRTSDILAAMEMLSKHTCITFHKRGTEVDYVFFQNGNGCASYIGFIGGKQSVFMPPQCSSGNIAHELLHTLGFQHEHTRSDRDQYIEVVQNNILPGMENNFNKINGETFGIPYDYTSIMHYGRTFFSSNGQATIIPKDSDVHGMGQRQKLMKSDIERVRHLYHCDDLKSNSMTDS
ncbi:astacin-like metalloprotease toxin 5 isoform X2 [Austrofundulus limnaeus]|uniref:Metalloendopeptidase n=1 Tax=Austrofundulus limnaeus TaxID=52670 RepID=A0A2I4C7M0_AUSLI|nr:PREDICTED: astacin-like metalloprotease toxin 5 isoform X2 [Austrofundulus limnaeus]